MKALLILCLCALCLHLTESTDEPRLEKEIIDRDEHLTKGALKEARSKVNRAVRRTEIKWMKRDVWDDPMTLFQFFKQPPNEETARMAMAGDVFECALGVMRDKMTSMYPRRFKRRVNATDMLSSKTLSQLATFSGCLPNLPKPNCPSNCLDRMYRTYSAMCNNEENPWWGAGNIPLSRWLPSQYENDFSTPQGWDPDKLYNSYKLPIVRRISNQIIGTTNQQVTGDPDYSHMLVVWGQYIDHDMDLTPQSLSTSTFQGLTDCSQTCENEPPCYPMQVPENDPRIEGVKCLPFFRSAAVCGTGDTSSLFNQLLPREQINAATSFIDASTVYGSTERSALNLRDLTNNWGLLRVNDRFKDENSQDYLPFNPNMPCVQDQFDASGENINCFLAGDPRASEHLTLSAIHTLWVREHNRIILVLKEINPHWSGEILYQEARKIVGAYHQVVHWKEYAPKILGPSGMNLMGEYGGYNPTLNPTISNVFATAAFRFGHVTISPEFRRLDENFMDHPQFPSILLHQAFFSAWRMIRQGGVDPILRGLVGRPAKLSTTAQLMHEELREKLFALQNTVALDLASLNLQRGRDHALPLYNDWREMCGFPRADNFSSLADVIRNESVRLKLEELYGHPGNVDIWLAGLVEDLEEGSRLGPTFNCLISKQFKALRDGDRFYYENPEVFSEDQRAALNQMTLSRVICDNSGVRMIQRDVFALADYPRDFVSCNDIPALNLEQWREDPNVGSCGTPPTIELGYWRKCGSGVMYRCNRNALMTGSARINCENGQFTPSPPTCSYVNKCVNNNGGCSDICEPNGESFTCRCFDGREMDETTKTCKDIQLFMNIPAVVVGVVLGVAVMVAAAALAVVIYKFLKLRSLSRYRRSSRFSLDGRPNVFDNPAMKTMDEKPVS